MDIRPKSFIKRVFDFAIAELDRRAQQAPQSQPARVSPPPGEPPRDEPPLAPPVSATEIDRHRPAGGLEVGRTERGALRVCWSVGDQELARSAGLIDDGAVLCLRLVQFSASRDHVVREVQDRPSVASRGECEIARTDGRTVVALGLRAGGRFVSIAHHVV